MMSPEEFRFWLVLLLAAAAAKLFTALIEASL